MDRFSLVYFKFSGSTKVENQDFYDSSDKPLIEMTNAINPGNVCTTIHFIGKSDLEYFISILEKSNKHNCVYDDDKY